MRLEQIDLDTWEAALPGDGFEVFHAPEALSVLGEHAPGELRLYGAYKGDRAVALLPAFVRGNPLGRVVTSPPPGMGVPRLGPLVMPASPKQRKREAVNDEFVDLVAEELAVDSRRSLLRLECPLSYRDPRPFGWAGQAVDTSFTYVLDLADTDPETVLSGFSRDLRKEIRRSEEVDLTVSIEGPASARTIFEDVRARYAAQGNTFPVSAEYFVDLVAALGDRCRVYVVRDGEGTYRSGIVVLYSNDTASFWQGGVASSYDGVSTNSILHWAIIEDVIEDPPIDSVSGYDLVGANTPRLCRYKSKFGADLVPAYTVRSSGLPMALARRAYDAILK